MSFRVATLKQRLDLELQAHRLHGEGWPTFLLHGDVAHWGARFDDFAVCQIPFYEPADILIAFGHTIPLTWYGTPEDLPSTISEIAERAMRTRRGRSAPNTLSALAAIVTSPHQSRGLSAEALRVVRSLARNAICSPSSRPSTPP